MRIIYLCLIFIVPVIAQQKFAIEPEDVSAIIGETILLPCRVVNKQGVLQWTKDDFGLGAHRNLSAFERYTMIGQDDNGDYTLQIENLTLEDDAKFQCQVSPGPNGKFYIIFFVSCFLINGRNSFNLIAYPTYL